MNCSAVCFLVRDTFRQARAAGILWFMLAVSLISIGVCLSGNVLADESGPGDGFLSLAYGSIRVPLNGDLGAAVRLVELELAGWVADAAGLLLALIWTASFLPSFLEPGSVTVLLVKPLPRWLLLAGKVAGVLVFMAFQASVFVAGTWMALGLRTGVWDPTYLLCIPLLLLHFGVFFSFSALVAVATRGTVACVLGSILFWMMAWGINFGRHATLLFRADAAGVSSGLGWTVEASYWMVPKPLDFHLILLNAFRTENVFSRLVDTHLLADRGAWSPGLSILSSCLCSCVLLGLAAYDFLTADY